MVLPSQESEFLHNVCNTIENGCHDTHQVKYTITLSPRDMRYVMQYLEQQTKIHDFSKGRVTITMTRQRNDGPDAVWAWHCISGSSDELFYKFVSNIFNHAPMPEPDEPPQQRQKWLIKIVFKNE